MGECRIRWYVYSGGERIRRQATMRGHWPGWDAECVTHNWDSKTGGATRGYVKHEVWSHKWDHRDDEEEG